MQHDISTQHKASLYKRMGMLALLAVCVLGFMALGTEPAMAQYSPMGNVICAIISLIYGNLGRGLAVLAVIVIGVGATLGKVSWGLAMTVAVGIGTIFGAVPLVAYLVTGNSGYAICGGSFGIQ